MKKKTDKLEIVDPNAKITRKEKQNIFIRLKNTIGDLFDSAYYSLDYADDTVDIGGYCSDGLQEAGDVVTSGLMVGSVGILAISTLVAVGVFAASLIWPEISADGFFDSIGANIMGKLSIGAVITQLMIFMPAICSSTTDVLSIGSILLGAITLPPMLLAKLGIKIAKGVTYAGSAIFTGDPPHSFSDDNDVDDLDLY